MMETPRNSTEHLVRIRNTAASLLERMQNDENSSAKELAALQVIIDVAEFGLLASSEASRQNALAGVRRLAEAWEANGHSAAVIRAIKDEELHRVPPATPAIN